MVKIIKILFAFTLILLCFAPDIQAKSSRKPYKITQDSEGIYVIEVNTQKNKYKLIPYYVDGLETNYNVYKNTGAKFVVNTAFFDPNNKQTVSYVTIDSDIVLNPKTNKNLMSNQTLKPYMDKILNRSEFRILKDKKGNILYDIAPHNEEVKSGYKIKHAIQTGPMLYPELRLEEEFFILVKNGKIVSESASALHKYARTAIGIKDNKVYIFIITNKAPMTLEEVGNLAKKWGMEKAMAFDGGGSTSFDSKELHIISDKDNSARSLKSFLILK